MSPQLEAWKRNVKRLSETEARFEEWLFIHLSGVLLGNKTGELLVLKEAQGRPQLQHQINCISKVAVLWGVSYYVLLNEKNSAKVIIYDKNKLQKVLSILPIWVLKELGYPSDLNANDFLNIISVRWRHSRKIPHEIAFALGYPIKDVLGYMGLVDLPFSGSCGWRIHGDPLPSIKISDFYSKAKERALAFINC